MSNDMSRIYLAKVKPESDDFPMVLHSMLISYKNFFSQVLDTINKEIIIKPNILPTEFRNDGLGVTNPKLCAHVADYLKELGFKNENHLTK